MIDPETVERIKGAADIVDVVGDYVHLTRRGSNYMGLCPFHNERTPSFSVNRQRNFCYCFSCKKGGSPVNFIMEKEGLNYYEALKHLARKYGIEVTERELTDEERQRQSAREAMMVANEWAMQLMARNLTDNDEGRDIGLSYFRHRGITDEAINAFRLGYAIDKGRHMVEAAKKSGFNLSVFKTLGLVGESNGREYDRFRGRVIFPIFNTAGKVIAFGGRDLKGGMAKYINSPESDLYKKSNELYGLFQAKGSIVREDKCFLVEGYMDVIGMWQAGLKNVVASSGTALTDNQISLLHRFTQNITLIYDGDAAGIKASLRGIDMLLAHKLNVKVLLLPDGHDPDSFAKEMGASEFREYIKENETDIIRYKARVMTDRIKEDPSARINAVRSVVESIAHIPDAIARDVYVQECATLMNLPQESVARSVAEARRAITQKLKADRLRRIYRDNDSGTSSTSHSQSALAGENAPIRDGNIEQDRNSEFTLPKEGNPPSEFSTHLAKLERELLRYAVRYGYLPVISFEDSDDDGNRNTMTLTVLDFISDELQADGITFTQPLYGQVFKQLCNLKEIVDTKSRETANAVESEIKKMREERYADIRERDLTVAQITKEEQKLEAEIEEYRQRELYRCWRDYPSMYLASHEDNNVRTLCVSLLSEQHPLSNLYKKAPAYKPEESLLNQLVTHVIDELKNEILTLKIKDELKRIDDADKANDMDALSKAQVNLASLMQIKKEMGRAIGDRVLENHLTSIRRKKKPRHND